MYLIDTDICIAVLRGNAKVEARIKNLSPDISVYTTIINVAELYYGALLSLNPDEQREKIEKLIAKLKILFLDLEVVSTFASIKYNLKKNNILIPDNDLYIASIAKIKKLLLVTHNIKHFQRIPDLKIEDWLA